MESLSKYLLDSSKFSIADKTCSAQNNVRLFG